MSSDLETSGFSLTCQGGLFQTLEALTAMCNEAKWGLAQTTL